MPLCCQNCFDDPILHKEIRDNGENGNCHYCGANDTLCIEASELETHFLNLAELYNEVENFMPGEELKEHEGVFLGEAIQDDWGIFNFEYEMYEKFLSDALSNAGGEYSRHPKLDSFVKIEHEYWGDDLQFEHDMSNAWREFSEEIKYGNRFFPTKSLDLNLLNQLLGHFTYTNAGSSYFRCRRSENGICKPLDQMGAPPRNSTPNGRANPHGISYLYLASDRLTALAETSDPKINAYSVGEFQVMPGLKILDLRRPAIDSPFRFGSELSAVMLTYKYLVKLSEEISKPIDKAVSDYEYVPIQYLCENFKHQGYDGIVFRSSKGAGYNLVLFNPAKSAALNVALFDRNGNKI